MSIIKDHKDKVSSKRFWGAVCMIVGLSMGIADGFHVYDASENIVLYILSAGTVTIGMGVFEVKKPGNE